MHVRCECLTDLRRMTILSSERLISSICFLDILLILWQSKHLNLNASMLTQSVPKAFFIKDGFWFSFRLWQFGIPYPVQRLWIVCVAYHHAGIRPWAKLALVALNGQNESTGIASKSRYFAKRGLMKHYFASSILHIVSNRSRSPSSGPCSNQNRDPILLCTLPRNHPG